MGLNWLITGGCGFIGRNLVKNILKEKGHEIRIIDNMSAGTENDLKKVCSPGDVDLIKADILDADQMVKAAENVDVIVHLAANTGVGPSVQDPRKDCYTNVVGTFNCLEAARIHHVKRFVFASSGAPAGECEPPINESVTPKPVSPYGASKLAGEGYCSAFFHSFGIETTALRFGNVYGEYSNKKDSVVAKFIKQLLQNGSVEIYGDGFQTRDFIYIQDLIQAVRRAVVAKGVGGQVFQIASGRETRIKEIADMIIEYLKKERPECNGSVFYSSKRTGDVQRNYSDISKAETMLGWKSETELLTGIQKTVQWFLG